MIRNEPVTRLIAELNETDETVHLEAKAISRSEVDKSVYETICAMANEPKLEGGTILLGVEKEEALFPFYNPSGVDDPDKVSSDIASGCATIFNNPIRVKISAEKIGKNIIVKIDVPELAPHQKPLYIKSRGLPKGAYRRIGPTDHRCNEEDLLLFFQGKDNTSYDTTIIGDATWNDIDLDAVRAYREIRRELNPLAEELRWSDQELVHALGGLRRLDGELRVTVAGLVVFGKSSALRRTLPAHRVDYIRVQGTTWAREISKEINSVELRGPLMTLVGRIIATITDDLPKAFRFDDGKSGQRTNVPALPVRAIREAVVNSLIHRSYQTNQPVQLVRYSNRIEFKNPGHSLKSEDRFDDPGSVMRNPHICEVLHETNYAETKGSGVRRMREVMEESGLTPPSLDSDRGADLFTAIFLFHHFLNQSDLKWLALFKEFDLTPDQHRALIFVREVGAIDNQNYRSLTKVDTLEASRSLKTMTTLQLLIKEGTGNRTYYVPGSAMLDRANLDDTLEPSSQGRANRLQGKDALLEITDVPEAIRKDLRFLSLAKRSPREKVEGAVLALCRWRALSADQIAALVSRNHTYFAQEYLTPMVQQGKLRHVHPEQPNHPNQMYTVNDVGE